MDEVTGMLIAVGGLFAGLLLLGWACGDFSQPKPPSPTDEPKP
jgi:hypothetical protein